MSSSRRTTAFARALAHPRALLAVIAIGVLLHAPVLRIGLVADDFVHALALDRPFDGMSAWNLYDFGGLDQAREAWALGGLPWWTSDGMHVRFLRPVTSLVRAFDHALADGAAWPGHLLNLALLAALLALAHAFLRRVGLPPIAAVLAVALWAVDESSMLPVGWLANRNSLLEALFGIAACTLVLSRSARAPLAAARTAFAILLALLAALSKESGLAFCALVPALAWWRARAHDRAPSDRHHTRHTALFVTILGVVATAAFLATYFAAGYGAESRFYPEPWHHPLAALAKLVALTGIGAVAVSSPFPADLVFLETRLTWPLVVIGAALIAAFGIPARRTTRERAAWRPAAPLVLFLVVTLAPQVAAPVGDRLLFVPGLAFAGLAALVIERVLAAALAHGRPLPRVATLWLLLALGANAVGLVARIATFARLGAESRSVAATLEPPTGCEEALVLQGPQGLALLSLGATWLRLHPERTPLAVHVMQMGPRSVTFERTSATDFTLTTHDEPFLTAPIEAVFLTADDSAPVGRRWRTRLFEVEALESSAAGPTRIALHFDTAPESTGIALVRATGSRTEALAWPAVGDGLTLPRAVSAIPFAP